MLFGGRIFGDAADQLIESVPLYEHDHALWEPLTALGAPIFANPNRMFWYPPSLLHVLPGSYDIVESSAFVIAAFGAYGLVRRLTGSVLGGIVAGFVYSLSGFMIGQAGHLSVLQPAAYVPYVFWALAAQRTTPRGPWLALGSLALALVMLSGQPQIFVYAIVLALVYVAVIAPGAPRGTWPFVRTAACTLGLGCGIAAVALIPAGELALLSTRAHLSFDMFVGYAVPAGELPLRLLFPFLLGATPMAPYRHSNFDFGSFAEMSVFVGGTTLMLVAIAVRWCGRSREVRFWFLVSVIALALGSDIGLAALTYHVPGYNLFRATNRHAFEFSLGAAILAGFGIAAIEQRVATPRRALWCCAVVAGIAAIITILMASFPRLLISQIVAVLGPVDVTLDPTKNAALWLPLLALAVGASAIVWWAGRPQANVRRGLLVLAVVADLACFAWFSYWNYGAFTPALFQAPPYAAALKERLAPSRQRLVTVPTAHLGTGIPPNLNLLWGIASARSYAPLDLRRTALFLPLESFPAMAPLLASNDRRLDVAGVRYLIVTSDAPAEQLASLRADPQRFRELSLGSGDHVFENARAFPSAWIVHRTIDVAPSDALARFADRRFDPHTAALVETTAPELAGPGASGDDVRVASATAGSLELAVRCERACFVVTSDANYPGWGATVDAAAAPIVTTDYALRGVFVPAGEHRLRLRYAPPSLMVGGAISLLSVVAVALLSLL